MTLRPFAIGPRRDAAPTLMPAAIPSGADARAFHRSMPGYARTPLVPVPELAARWNVTSVHVKDESARLGLPAFKILGASWAENRALSARSAAPPCATLAELAELASSGTPATLVTATDGNHGRALARMARLLGLPARIYVPDGLPESTVAAIESEGATVLDTDEIYDAAVVLAAQSISDDDVLIQDTSWPGYQGVPGWIVDGYATMFAEIDEQAGGTPAMIAVPTGVGSLLQAALQHYRQSPTRVLAVEPVTAACVTASLAAGKPVTVDTSAFTTMAGLNCGTVSTLAWPLIRARLDAGIGVTDGESAWAAAILRNAGVDSGPCGAASAAGVEAARGVPGAIEALGLDASARLVLLSTEGSGTPQAGGGASGTAANSVISDRS